MTFEEYQQIGRPLYVALVVAVQNILDQALDQYGLVAHGITGRAKELESLRKKLADRGISFDQPMNDIKDLAGCRIVFLTNSQVDGFNSTGALHENFEVISVNVHHPVPGTDTETRLFDSTNYLVRLKPDRLALAEYRKFDGLQIEIQIQTLLNHAWAEMGHDTIYKEPKLTHLGVARMAAIGDRMNRVMQEHLVPAGHDFDKIARDFHRLLKADGAAEDTLDSIARADTNNVLEDALETFEDLVLPHFDDPSHEFTKQLDTLVDAVERSRDYAVMPIVTEIGDFPGKSSLDVARRVSQLMVSYRYVEPERIFRALVRLYLGARVDAERALWIEAGEKLAKHTLAVWKQHGPAAQRVVVDEVERLDADAVRGARSLLTSMLAQVLSAELGGTTWTSESAVIHQGVVGISEEMRQLRGRAIDWLERWLDEAADDAERLTFLRALGTADTMPMQGGGDEALFLMLLEDGARVAKIILARAPQWSLELRRSREVDALHTHYRFHVLRPDLAQKPELVAAQKDLIAAILGLRDQLAADEELVRYKTLVGHDTVRPAAWDGDHFDFEATDAWRLERYPTIIAEITAETVPLWRERIDSYVEAAGGDGGHFISLRAFLKLFAEQKPDLALAMMEEVSDRAAAFVASILQGLDGAGRNEEARALVDGWVAAGRFLVAIGNYLQEMPTTDAERLQVYVAKAISSAEQVAVVKAATIAAKWYQGAADPLLIAKVFMPALRFMTESAIPHWIGHFFPPRDSHLIQSLSEPESVELLQSFVGVPEIDYREVRLLETIGSRHPQLVIDFFGDRLRRERRAGERFDAVPFHPFDLADVLSPHADRLLPAMRVWYEEQPEYHEYRGGRLFKHAFPELTDALAGKLTEIAREGDEADFKFLLRTLAPYEGAEQIYPVLMEVVDRVEPGDRMLTKVSNVLGETGVVSGEFGFVEVHARRKELIERYRDDPRPRVQAYARARARELAQHMAWEQRRAARDVAQRRRDWNEE
jgi:ppGpp synthetase/RelA/SpoT-type nucleotidyltranferase